MNECPDCGSDDIESIGRYDFACVECGSEFEGEPDSEEDEYSEFQDPGGNSALRAETASNPRNLPCGTCHQENRLTPKDKALGYQCDQCADRQEQGGY